MSKLLSIVVPCYHEEEMLPLFYAELMKQLQTLPIRYEIIFIDDGSRDHTLSVMKTLAEKDSGVRYLSFSRNFGKESAMFAGLTKSTGDYVVLMDCDLQDPPSLLGEMLEILESGDYDCVATYRSNRRDEPWLRSVLARGFYRLMRKISNVEIRPNARDFRMMTRQVVNATLQLTEKNRFSKGLLAWVGFETHWIGYENKERGRGKTKWRLGGLLWYSLDAIASFSAVPLLISSIGGALLCVSALAMMLYFITKTLLFGDPVEGYPSLVSIILFLGGVQLLSVGVVGYYLSKTYTESKARPIYIEKESNFPVHTSEVSQEKNDMGQSNTPCDG